MYLTLIQDAFICVLGHLLCQTVEQNVSRLITAATAGRIPKQFV